MTERELASSLVTWYTAKHPDAQAFEEVQALGTDRIVDLVFRFPDGALHAVECKKALGLPVFDQALAIQDHAHRVSVAALAPAPFKLWQHRLRPGIRWACPSAVTLAGSTGIGILLLTRSGWHEEAPAITRTPASALRLFDGHQATGRAGSPSATGRHTEWKEQQAQILAYVTEHPGCTSKEIAAALAPQFLTKAGQITTWHRNRWLKGLRTERRHFEKENRFYLDEF